MPRRSELRAQPRHYLAPNCSWLDGALQDDAPLEAVLVQSISKKFRDHIKARGLNHSQAAKKARIARTTVLNILSGNTWLDLPTIDRMERNLGIHFWNRDHHPPPSTGRPQQDTST